MTLEIATEGCCKGHPCDNCKTCQSGRCCRRDNPDYKLPGLGEWDGPIYGELGVLNDDGDKVECHCCGEWFVFLGTHIYQSHDITAREYKSIFGLFNKTALASQSYCDKQRQANAERLRKWNTSSGLLVSPIFAMTPEQRSDLNSGRKARLAESVKQSSRGRYPRQGREKSQYRGISQYRDGKWMLQIGYHRERLKVFGFLTPEQAARAYDAKARELYGDKARLNFPGETS